MSLGTPGSALYRARMRVAWSDTDASGRIHFTAAFRWAEVAEHAALRELGLAEMGDFPRRHVEATYHRSLCFNDEFELIISVEKIGRTSITYSWNAVRDGELCIEGRTVTVHVGPDGAPTPLPENLHAQLWINF